MAGNKTLKNANKEKNDEFYTRLEDIENELKHYKNNFKDKVIFCNCDDPYESNFFKYFAMNFNTFGLKKLIATCYTTSPVANTQLSLFDILEPKTEDNRLPHKIEITEVLDFNNDGAVDLVDVEYLLRSEKNTLTLLNGDGDFRSEECIELLKQADIVATNPPFSLFREYVATLVEYDKDFIVIGNTNALTYKEIFTLIKENKLRTGYTNFNVGMYFYVPDSYEKYHKKENGRKMVRVSTSCWFSTLEVKKHKEDIILYKTYNPQEYPTYDNFNAINVNSYVDIPCDYDGIMGVPITFMDKYNPDQFEIIGMAHGNMGQALGVSANLTEEQCVEYKNKNKAFRKGFVCYTDNNGELIVPYMRVLIKRKR